MLNELEIESYTPLTLGFVLDVIPKQLPFVKKEIVDIIRFLESDEKAYVYHPKQNTVPQKIGKSVADIANYNQHPENISSAIRNTLYTILLDNIHAKKYIITILTNLDEVYQHKIAKTVELDLKSGYEFNFIFCQLNSPNPFLEKLKEINDKCHYISCQNSTEFAHLIKQKLERTRCQR